MPPAIVFVGTQDKLLPVDTVKSFCEQARAAGTKCEYRVYEGQPHGFFNQNPALNQPIPEAHGNGSHCCSHSAAT